MLHGDALLPNATDSYSATATATVTATATATDTGADTATATDSAKSIGDIQKKPLTSGLIQVEEPQESRATD